jgi:uncharacterized protein
MKFLIAADIHGSIHAWLTLKALMDPDDILVIAGDLFDTRYGQYGHPDFSPEAIRQDLTAMNRTVHYVYGNCDVPAFFPGHHLFLTVPANNRNMFIHHGYPRVEVPADADIIIQGHTHAWQLEKQDHRIFMNPGSLPRPRSGPPTYGMLDDTSVRIMTLDSGSPLTVLAL